MADMSRQYKRGRPARGAIAAALCVALAGVPDAAKRAAAGTASIIALEFSGIGYQALTANLKYRF